MLKDLRIKNFALIDRLETEFQPGLNVITGATGAGKSVIVGAANLILGERASIELVRSGSETATIEATFLLPKDSSLKEILDKWGPFPQDDLLIIQREISSKGQSKSFINDRMVTLSTLKSIGDRLADLHGQHQHQSLLNPERHIEYLDHYAELDEDLSRLSQLYALLRKRQKDLTELKNSKNVDEEKRKLYQFQIQEIEKANLSPDEEERLGQERRVLENTEALFELASDLHQQLYEGEGSILEGLTFLARELKKNVPVDARLKQPAETSESCVIALQDVARFLQDYKNRLEFDPERLERIRERLDLLVTLKRKYDRSIQEILKYKEEMERELKRMENKDYMLINLEKEVFLLSQNFQRECELLSEKRKAKATELSERIQNALSTLGMEKAKFEIKIIQREDESGLVKIKGKRFFADQKGMDQVEFFISPNPGEELKPLAKIASGGEVSRIMLALKTVLAKADRVETMIFDEIDVGIGGEVALTVGKSLKKLATDHQVIVITHLQQIASQADHHFKVFKESVKGRTVIRIRRLDKEQRIKEIARMISGEKISQVTLKQAKEMIKTTSTSGRSADLP